MDALNRINAALAMPHTHKVVTTFADGATRIHTSRSLQTAQLFAVGEQRKIGRDLINRDTGATVRVVSVDVLPLVELAA
jgi:hypothetical protein